MKTTYFYKDERTGARVRVAIPQRFFGVWRFSLTVSGKKRSQRALLPTCTADPTDASKWHGAKTKAVR